VVTGRSSPVRILIFCNLRFQQRIWEKFAGDNDGSQSTVEAVIGRKIFQVIPEVPRPFYIRAFNEGLSKGVVWQHIYECSSPQRSRKFRKRPLAGRCRGVFRANERLSD
jgi:hypothetical protein